MGLHCAVTIPGESRYNYIPAGYVGKVYINITSNDFMVGVHGHFPLVQFVFVNMFSKVRPESSIHLKIDSGQYYCTRIGASKVLSPTVDPLPNDWYLGVENDYNSVVVSKGPLYLFSCAERIELSQYKIGILRPYEESLGEFRSHYAGFFDPGFSGYPVLELRAFMDNLRLHNMQTVAILDVYDVSQQNIMSYEQQQDAHYGDKSGNRILPYFIQEDE